MSKPEPFMDEDRFPYVCQCNHLTPHRYWIRDKEDEAKVMFFHLGGWDKLWCPGYMPRWLGENLPAAPAQSAAVTTARKP